MKTRLISDGVVVGARAWWVTGLALFALAGLLSLGSGSASALPARGHVFGVAIEGSAEHPLSSASGVAVDEASGEVYVLDTAGERVDRFKPDGAGGYEFASEFAVHTPVAIAVDNCRTSAGAACSKAEDPSVGDVYVTGGEHAGAEPSERGYVHKFTASGEKIYSKNKFRIEGSSEELELEEISGVAVDAHGRVWVYWEEEGATAALSDTEVNKALPGLMSGRFEGMLSEIGQCRAVDDFAVAVGDEAFYEGYERENSGEECPGELEEPPDPYAVAKFDSTRRVLLAREVQRAGTTGVAVDPASGDVYLDSASSVAAFTPSGGLIQRFGTGTLTQGEGVAVDGGDGDVFVADPGADRVDVFVPEATAGAPIVDQVSSQNLTPSSARLSAQIDPRGAQTEYYFQYGTADCATNRVHAGSAARGADPCRFRRCERERRSDGAFRRDGLLLSCDRAKRARQWRRHAFAEHVHHFALSVGDAGWAWVGARFA